MKSLSVDIPGNLKGVPCKYTVTWLKNLEDKIIQKIIINAQLRHYFKQIIISKDESITCIKHYYVFTDGVRALQVLELNYTRDEQGS